MSIQNTPIEIQENQNIPDVKKVTLTSEKASEMAKMRTGYAHTEETKNKISGSLMNREFSKEHRQHISDAKKGKPLSLSETGKQKLKESNTVYKYTIVNSFGEIFETTNLEGFCKERGLDPSNMHKVANGKRIQYKGWMVTSKVKINKTLENKLQEESEINGCYI